VVVTLKMTNEADYGMADPMFATRWAVVSSNGTPYGTNFRSVSHDSLGDSGLVPSGLSAVGNVDFLVKSDDVQGLRLYVEESTLEYPKGPDPILPNFEGEGAFLALEE
jgi:hypothetical protein